MVSEQEKQPAGDLADFEKPPSLKTRALQMLTFEQWTAFKHALQKSSLRNEALIMLMYECALRRSEPCNIQLGHLQLDKQRIYIKRLKKSRDGWYEIQPTTITLLREWVLSNFPQPLKKQWYLFPGNRRKGSPAKGLSGRAVFDVYTKIATEAALPDVLKHPHVLRRTRGQHLLELAIEEGVPLDQMFHTIAKLLGHRNARNTIQYYLKETQATKAFVQKATQALVAYFGEEE